MSSISIVLVVESRLFYKSDSTKNRWKKAVNYSFYRASEQCGDIWPVLHWKLLTKPHTFLASPFLHFFFPHNNHSSVHCPQSDFLILVRKRKRRTLSRFHMLSRRSDRAIDQAKWRELDDHFAPGHGAFSPVHYLWAFVNEGRKVLDGFGDGIWAPSFAQRTLETLEEVGTDWAF